jgi:hypothetical protein
MLAAAAAMALVVQAALGAMYKWTDANGRVVYSDLPPPGNVKVETVNAPPPPTNPNAAKELATKQLESAQKRQQRAEDDAKSAKAKADTDKKREECEKVQGQIALLLNSDQMPFYQSNAKGEPVYMDDSARRRELEQRQIWMRDNCRA